METLNKQKLKRRRELIDLHSYLQNRGYTLGTLLDELADLYCVRTQKEFADIMGVTVGLICHFKKGRRGLKHSTYIYYLDKLDKALTLDIRELKEYLK